MIKEVTEEQFTTLLREKSTLAAFFHTPFCGTCSLARHILDEAVRSLRWEEKNIVVACNLNLMPQYAETYKIMSVPSLLLFKNGQYVDRLVVFRSRNEIYYMLTKLVD